MMSSLLEGFRFRGGMDACTEGIWIWLATQIMAFMIMFLVGRGGGLWLGRTCLRN